MQMHFPELGLAGGQNGDRGSRKSMKVCIWCIWWGPPLDGICIIICETCGQDVEKRPQSMVLFPSKRSTPNLLVIFSINQWPAGAKPLLRSSYIRWNCFVTNIRLNWPQCSQAIALSSRTAIASYCLHRTTQYDCDQLKWNASSECISTGENMRAYSCAAHASQCQGPHNSMQRHLGIFIEW